MTTRRTFIKGAALAAPAAALATPAIGQSTIKWRMQTYAGAALAEHVVKPAIDTFNKIAGDRMQIELFFADQLVPTGELFQACLLYTSPSPRDLSTSRMPSSA